MFCIVGLGNPEPTFDQTRHNAGFMVLNALAERIGAPPFRTFKKCQAHVAQHRLDNENVLLIKPATYMNESGLAVRQTIEYFKLTDWQENLYIVHDDLDLALGSYKIQLGTGPKIHNGLLSTYQHLGSKVFWHVRVGVDGRGGERTMPAANYVVGRFSEAELRVFAQTSQTVVDELIARLHG